VDPLELTTNFASILSNPPIASKVLSSARLFLSVALCC
jgi:hypothetical protein